MHAEIQTSYPILFALMGCSRGHQDGVANGPLDAELTDQLGYEPHDAAGREIREFCA
jgi:hypothetical protein